MDIAGDWLPTAQQSLLDAHATPSSWLWALLPAG